MSPEFPGWFTAQVSELSREILVLCAKVATGDQDGGSIEYVVPSEPPTMFTIYVCRTGGPFDKLVKVAILEGCKTEEKWPHGRPS